MLVSMRRAGALLTVVMAVLLGLLSPTPAGADPLPSSVSIGAAATAGDGSYYNAQDLADNMVFTNLVVQAAGDITIVDPSDLSTSAFGLPFHSLTLVAPTCNISRSLNFAAFGHLTLTCATVNFSAHITSGAADIAASRITSTATQVNVVSNAASIQQAIDDSSHSSAPVIQVGPGSYAENLTLDHPLTLRGTDGSPAPGADPGAPTLAGTQPGGTVITAMADGVTIDGLHLDGLVAGGSAAPSVSGIVADGVDSVSIHHNTLDGFSGPAIDTTGSTNVAVDANVTTPTLLSTTISPTDPTIEAGTDLALTDTGSYSEGPTADLTTQATWTSSDATVATVDTVGLVHGVGPGTTTVTAVVGDFSATTDVTVTPAIVPSATVTFDANGGVGSMAAQTANTSTTLTANTFTRAGFAFTGWNTSADGGGTAYADGAAYPFTADVVLYAQWTANVSQPQTITFAVIGSKTLLQSPVTVAATASSGLAVSFATTTPSVCTAGGPGGATITLLRTGTCRVRASQPGNAIYSAAPNVARSFAVSKATQVISFPAIGSKTLAQSPVTVAATASSGLPVSFATTTPAVCTAGGPGGATITLLRTGTCQVRASQPGNATYSAAPKAARSFAVSKATQVISFAAIGSKTLAQSPVTVAATASSGLAVSFATTTPAVCTAGGPAGATITLLGTGTCRVRASQPGNATYSAAPAIIRSFSVS